MMLAHVVSINHVHVDHIRASAELAADSCAGPQANPFPEGSEPFKRWNEIYYAAVQAIAVESVQ